MQIFKNNSHFKLRKNTVYNELPNKIKKCEQYSTAVNQLRKYFIDKTIARALSMS